MSADTEPAGRDRVIGHGTGDYEDVMARLESLSRLQLASLVLPSRVALVQGDMVAVSEHSPYDESLEAILAARGQLRAGEAVWVGMGVAHALAALHKAGVVHGAIAPAAVWVSGGRVALSHLADGAVSRTPTGQCPTQEDDVAALGELLAQAVRDQDSARLRAWTDPMTHPDPAGRPSAAMVARALTSCAPAEPVAPAHLGVASALRRAINGRQAEPARARAGAGPVVALPEARWWRLRRAVGPWVVKGALAASVVAVLALGGVGVVRVLDAHADDTEAQVQGRPVAASTTRDAGASSAPPAGAHEPLPSPVEAATGATLARFDAISAGDTAALVATTAAGSEARGQAEELATQMSAGDFSVEGLAGVVTEAALIRLDGPDGPTRAPAALVRIRYSLSPHAVTRDGQREDYEAYDQTVELRLEWDGAAAWKVASVTEAAG